MHGRKFCQVRRRSENFRPPTSGRRSVFPRRVRYSLLRESGQGRLPTTIRLTRLVREKSGSNRIRSRSVSLARAVQLHQAAVLARCTCTPRPWACCTRPPYTYSTSRNSLEGRKGLPRDSRGQRLTPWDSAWLFRGNIRDRVEFRLTDDPARRHRRLRQQREGMVRTAGQRHVVWRDPS